MASIYRRILRGRLLAGLLIVLGSVLLVYTYPVQAQRPSLSGLQEQIDELQAENDEQQTQIDGQQAQIDDLTTRVETLEAGGEPGAIPQCADGIDNDGDGLTDYPADTGCWSDIDNDETDPSPFEGKIVFYVDTTGRGGDFGGVSGADAICQEHADAAGLTGIFLAWISDNNFANTPKHRFNKYYLKKYVLPDKTTIVANNWDDLTDGDLQHTINMLASGEVVPTAQYAFTNVAPDGGMEEEPWWDCNGWTSSSSSEMGNMGYLNWIAYPDYPQFWTSIGTNSIYGCSIPSSGLYCFEQ